MSKNNRNNVDKNIVAGAIGDRDDGTAGNADKELKTSTINGAAEGIAEETQNENNDDIINSDGKKWKLNRNPDKAAGTADAASGKELKNNSNSSMSGCAAESIGTESMEKGRIKLRRMKKGDRIIKAVIQIIFFIWIPESFAVSLYALKQVVCAVMQQNYSMLPEYLLILAGTCIPTVLLGRYYCGYICSFGAMQDLVFGLRCTIVNKVASFFEASKFSKNSKNSLILSASADRLLSCVKYIILAGILLASAAGFSALAEISPWTSFGKIIDGASELFSDSSMSSGGTGMFSNLLSDGISAAAAGLVILLLIAVLSAFIKRAFCRYMCPMGAFYSLISVFSHEKRTKKCGSDGNCAMCRYACAREHINYTGLILTVIIFAATNLLIAHISTDAGFSKAEMNNEFTGTSAASNLKDGIYEGSARGYRSEISVAVTVENGMIYSVQVTEHDDDAPYMNSVINQLIPEIIAGQSAEIDVVSGATYSSRGLLDAVNNALGSDLNTSGENMEISGDDSEKMPNDSASGPDLSHIEDGVYEGRGMGFRGDTTVLVTVKNGKIKNFNIVSYYDDKEYLFYAANEVTDALTEGRKVSYDAVSGATYSSNSMVKAVSDALQIDAEEFGLFEEKPRKNKKNKGREIPQKFVTSEEEYLELLEKYRDGF